MGRMFAHRARHGLPALAATAALLVALVQLGSSCTSSNSMKKGNEGGSEGATSTGGTAGTSPAPVGGTGGGATPEPRSDLKLFWVGHSLMNTDVPWMVKGIAESAGLTTMYRQQLNIGAALRANWEQPTKFNPIPVWNDRLGRDEEWGANPQTELPTGKYDALLLTEAIPVDKQIDSALYAGNYVDLAVRGRKDTAVYLYETWDFVAAGGWPAWRTRIDQWRPVWEKIADDVMAKRPGGPTMHIVPGGQAMAALYDAIKAKGSVGQLTDIKQVFEDDIHLNPTGNYFIALVSYATVFRRDPSGTGAVSAGPYKKDTVVVTDQATRSALQALAWQVARGYARSGLNR
jgi:hypothetical protein